MKSYMNDLPGYIIYFVTAKCNAKCSFCFYYQNIDQAPFRKDLKIEEIEKIAKNFNDLQHVTLSGGEPSLRKDLPEICRIFDRNNRVQFITFPTNGLMPDRIASQVEEIITTTKNPYLKLCISLDGLGHDHDTIRGVPGNFDKVVETYDKVLELKENVADFEIQFNTTVTAFNKDKIEEISDYIDKRFSKAIHNACLVRGTAVRDESSRDVPLERYREIRDYIENKISSRKGGNYKFSKVIRSMKLVCRDEVIKREETGIRTTPCSAGKKMVVIDDEGNVFPCELLWDRFTYGNLRDVDYDIRKLLSTDNASNIRNFIDAKKCSCTFENALQNSIIYNKEYYPALIKKMISTKNVV